MNAKKLFPSNYICDDDLGGKDATLTMDVVKMELMPNGDSKGVLYFKEAQKGMTLNKTNGKRIMAMYGDETDKWVGKQITIYPSETQYQGETVGCVRVRDNRPGQQAAPPASESPEPQRVESPAPQPVAAKASGVGF